MIGILSLSDALNLARTNAVDLVEIAATAVFLASDMASAITGQLIPIDAGLP